MMIPLDGSKTMKIIHE